jgi:predicted PurR-regulated permease PerM
VTTPSDTEPRAASSERDHITRLVRGCVILLLLAVIIFSRTIAVPALAAVLVSIALFPVVNRAARLGVPRALASLLVLAALVSASLGLLYAVRQPLAQLAARGPEFVNAGRQLVATLANRPLPAAAAGQAQPSLEVVGPLAAGLVESLVAVGASLILTHFILTCGTSVGRALLAAVRGRNDRRSWLRVYGSIRTQAAHYLQLVTAINITFGLITALLLSLMEVKDAAAYGAIAGLMNFIPIVGALVTAGVVLAGGLAEHGASAAIIAPVAMFLGLHVLESQFITPQLLGRRLLLNPLIVIAGVMVGAAAWGVGGAFLAVPMLTSVKIALDAHPRSRPWGQVLGRGALADSHMDEARRMRLRRSPRRRPTLAKSPSET